MNDDWERETLHPDYAQSLRIDRLLHESGEGPQRLRLFENRRFGRVLTLDGNVQLTTADEFIYHEMMAHVPILAHGSAARILIVGGGDGGLAREVLRHPGVKAVTLVEIDPAVIAFSRDYLPTVSAGAFDDPRLTVTIADGAAFIANPPWRYDVILVDSTDPVGPGEVLFTDHFYGHAHRALAPGGILVTQNGVPFLQPEELRGTMRAFRTLFADATCYLAGVPTYAGGPLALGWGSDGVARHTPLATLEARYAAAAFSTRCYTPELHVAAFALPRYIRDLTV